jgi:hypothetical protein
MRRLTLRLLLDAFPPHDLGLASCPRTLDERPVWERVRERTVAAWFAIIH